MQQHKVCVLLADGSVQPLMIRIKIVASLWLLVCQDKLDIKLELDNEKNVFAQVKGLYICLPVLWYQLLKQHY